MMPVLFHCTEDAKLLHCLWVLPSNAPTLNDSVYMGGFLTKDAINVCKQNRNIYLDTSEIPFVDAIREAAKYWTERILFGSDLPTDNPQFEIEKIKAIKEVENLISGRILQDYLLDLEGQIKIDAHIKLGDCYTGGNIGQMIIYCLWKSMV